MVAAVFGCLPARACSQQAASRQQPGAPQCPLPALPTSLSSCPPTLAWLQTWGELDAFYSLIRRCWAQLPQDRPNFQEVIAELRWAGEEEDSAAVLAEPAPELLWLSSCCAVLHCTVNFPCPPFSALLPACRDMLERTLSAKGALGSSGGATPESGGLLGAADGAGVGGSAGAG